MPPQKTEATSESKGNFILISLETYKVLAGGFHTRASAKKCAVLQGQGKYQLGRLEGDPFEVEEVQQPSYRIK